MTVTKRLAIERGFDIKHDDFMLVQPFDDNQAITVIAQGKGKDREIKIFVNDETFILPKESGVLDIFKERED